MAEVTDITEALDQQRRMATANSLGALDEDPEQAARSLELGKATGVNPSAIYGDVEGFERQHKAFLNSELIRYNDHLQDYINSHPMAARVSSDDLAQLDRVSEATSNLSGATEAPIFPAFRSLKEAFHDFDINYHQPEETAEQVEFRKNWPEMTKFIETLAGDPRNLPFGHPARLISESVQAGRVGFDVMSRLLSGALNASGAYVQQDAILRGMDPADAQRLGREVSATLEHEAIKPGHSEIVRHLEAYAQGHPWIQADKKVPFGVHELIDKAYKQEAKDGVKSLDNLTKESQKSATYERSQELLSNFVGMRAKGNIGISVEGVKQLYGINEVPYDPAIKVGDQVFRGYNHGDALERAARKLDLPFEEIQGEDGFINKDGKFVTRQEANKLQEIHAEDGKLGWIPDLEQQLAAAEKIGGDITVPVKDWVAKVDPEIAKQLEEYLRVSEDGITLAEGERKKEIREALASIKDVEKIESAAIKMGEEVWGGHGHADAWENLISEHPELRDARPKGLITGFLTDKGRFLTKEEALKLVGEDEGTKAVGKALAAPRGEDEEKVTPLAIAVDAVRGAAGLDTPMAQIGPKMTLKEIGPKDLHTYREYHVVDEEGRPRIHLEVAVRDGGKRLHVGVGSLYSAGLKDFGANLYGPKLMLQIAEQLHTEFPFAEKLSGIRTTGAKAGGIREDKGLDTNMLREHKSNPRYVEVPLPLPRKSIGALAQIMPGFTAASELSENFRAFPVQEPKMIKTAFRGGTYTVKTIGSTHVEDALRDSTTTPGGVFKPFFRQLRRRISEVAGEIPVHIVSDEDFAKVLEGEEVSVAGKKLPPGGYYHPDFKHIIIPESIYKTREGNQILLHESIHAATWDMLDDSAREVIRSIMNEVEKQFPDARSHYGFTNEAEFLSETFANKQFQDLLLKTKISKELADALGIKEWRNRSMWDGFIQWVANLLKIGKDDVTALEASLRLTDYFIDRIAEIQREDREQFLKGTALAAPTPFEKPTDIGLNKKKQEQYDELIARKNMEDAKRFKEEALKYEQARQTQEWKEESAKIRGEVRDDVYRRPDIAADTFLRTGELYGQKQKGRPRLDANALTPEQKKLLPMDYYSDKGIDPDVIAKAFGYTTGDAMVSRLGMLEAERKQFDLGPKEHINKIVEDEVERRMQKEHGDLGEKILKAAEEHVVSETQFDLLHEDILRLGMQAGVDTPITKAEIRRFAKSSIDDMPAKSVSVEKMLKLAGKAGDEVQDALLFNDAGRAYIAKQRQAYIMAMAMEAKKIERAKDQFDRFIKTNNKVSRQGMSQEYLNFIHDIMARTGKLNQRVRSEANIKEANSQLGYESLKDFVNAKSKSSFGLLQMPIADHLLDPNFRKNVDAMKTWEFMETKRSLDLLAKLGREEETVISAGNEVDRKELRAKLIDKLKTFPRKDLGAKEEGKVLALAKTYLAAGHVMETLLNRWDRNDPRGLFNRTFSYPLAKAASEEARLRREFSKMWKGLEIKDANKEMDSPLIDPLTRTDENPDGRPYTKFTKANGLRILQQLGNKQNWYKLTRGMGLDEAGAERLKQWVFQNFTKADFDRAQKIGDIFGHAFKLAEKEYIDIYGRAPEKIPLEPIETPYGTYRGWYDPLIADRRRLEGQSEKQAGGGAYDDHDYGHAAIANGWSKSRTGAVYTLDLNWAMVPARLNQILHDTAYRQVVLNTQKIFGDRVFRDAVTTHYSPYHSEGLMPYLKGIAGGASIDSAALARAADASEYLRQNVIGSYIGFNPYTALKHGPTAWVYSMREIGIARWLKGTYMSYGLAPELAKANRDFIDKWGEEVNRRHRHWIETIAGQFKNVFGEHTFREKVLEQGSRLVAASDMLSVRGTWLGAYQKAIEAGDDHGLAIDLADRAVRRAHGSTAITNLPAIVRSGGALHSWMTTLFGFFGTTLQRRIEIMHQLNDVKHLGKAGEINKAVGRIPRIVTDVMIYYVIPTAIEEYVTGLTTDDKRGWGTHLLLGAAAGFGSTLIYFRDVLESLYRGQPPGVGLISSPLHDHERLAKDLAKGTKMFTKDNAANTVSDAMNVFGIWTGMSPRAFGSATKFGMNLMFGKEHPKSFQDWRMGITRGQTKKPAMK